MSDHSLSFVFSFIDTIMSFCSYVFDNLFTDVWTILENGDDSFSRFLLGLLDFLELETFLQDFSLIGFLFSSAIFIALIIYFFIP